MANIAEPDLRTLRARVADCEWLLAEAIWADKVTQAQVEQAGIEAASGDYGKNKEDRDRYLVLWIGNDPTYDRARRHVIECQNDLRRAQAEAEAFLLVKRDERVRATEKLADALLAGAPAVVELVS